MGHSRDPRNKWEIVFNRHFFWIHVEFCQLNPRLEFLLHYGEWRDYIFNLKLLEKELPKRRKAGEILFAAARRRRSYHTSKMTAMLVKHYGKRAKVKFTDAEKKTGIRNHVNLHLFDEGPMGKVSIRFERDLFLEFKAALLNADRILQRKLRRHDPSGVYWLTPRTSHRHG